MFYSGKTDSSTSPWLYWGSAQNVITSIVLFVVLLFYTVLISRCIWIHTLFTHVLFKNSNNSFLSLLTLPTVLRKLYTSQINVFVHMFSQWKLRLIHWKQVVHQRFLTLLYSGCLPCALIAYTVCLCFCKSEYI